MRSIVYHQADSFLYTPMVWWDTTRQCRVDDIHAKAWWYTKPVGLDKKTLVQKNESFSLSKKPNQQEAETAFLNIGNKKARYCEKCWKVKPSEGFLAFHNASFFRFIAAHLSLTHLVTWANPLYCVYLIPYFSLASPKHRSIVSFRFSYTSFISGVCL